MQPTVEAVENHILRRVQTRVAAQPNDPVAWRMLGKVLLLEGNLDEARNALERAVQLDPQRVAAQFDLAETLSALGETQDAVQAYQRVIDLAPGSDDAKEARRQLAQLPNDLTFRLADFQPRWTEAAEIAEQQSPVAAETSSWSWRVELGTLYNSNVDLAPISRELSALEDGGFQAFVEPSLEYLWLTQDHLTSGIALEGYFAINEPDNTDFNLQHHQPGVFCEFPFYVGNCEIVPQLRYDFSYDIFAGETLGTRHLFTTSLATYESDGASWILFSTGDVTDFRDDGADPSMTSLDGPTYSLGVVRRWPRSGTYFEDVCFSVDGQWADLRGSNYAYRGAFLLMSSTCPLDDCWELRPEFGWGFRVYPNFVGSPNRDESIWRCGLEVRRWLSDNYYLSCIGNYDRFDSANDDYAAQRYTAGLSATYLR